MSQNAKKGKQKILWGEDLRRRRKITERFCGGFTFGELGGEW
jgi:hypothetical protein